MESKGNEDKSALCMQKGVIETWELRKTPKEKEKNKNEMKDAGERWEQREREQENKNLVWKVLESFDTCLQRKTEIWDRLFQSPCGKKI